MNKYLKQDIFNWLIENEHEWQRVTSCVLAFRPYIYDSEGNYLKYGGKEVADFISKADKLIYGNEDE